MAKLVNNSESSHWYDIDGNACHRQPYADKKRAAAGETRATTLRDARKLTLLPSVTNVLGVTAKPQLESWKIEQALLAAAENPFKTTCAKGMPDYVEEMEEWVKATHLKSKEQVTDAADRGKKAHAAAEKLALRMKAGDATPPTVDPEVRDIFMPAQQWMQGNLSNIQRAEFTVVGDGYAGTLDLWCEIAGMGQRIGDFKTRKWKKGKKPGIYPEDGTQLAAYRRAVVTATGGNPAESPLGMTSILINSTEPDDVFVHDWTPEEIAFYDRRWLLIHELWCHDKKYNPRIFS